MVQLKVKVKVEELNLRAPVSYNTGGLSLVVLNSLSLTLLCTLYNRRFEQIRTHSKTPHNTLSPLFILESCPNSLPSSASPNLCLPKSVAHV